MKPRIGRRSSEPADVVGNVEINGVVTLSIDLDVFSIWSKCLKGARHREWNLRLVRPQKHLDLVWAAIQRSHILGLHVLEVDEHKIGFQTLPLVQSEQRPGFI